MGLQKPPTDASDPIRPIQPLRLPPSASVAFDVLTRRWVPQVLYLLCQRPARFSELAQAIPSMSRRVLMDRLRQLDNEGLLRRLVDPGPPTRITYQVTDMGADLRTTLEHAHLWGERYVAARP